MRGLLGPGNTFQEVLQRLAIQRNAGSVSVPPGANLSNCGWLFGNEVKLILSCTREELLQVVQGLMDKLQTASDPRNDATRITERALSLIG